MSIPTTGSTNGWLADQEALSGTAEMLVPRRPQRYRITIKNIDGSITVYVGHDLNVGPTTGMALLAGESISLYTSDEVWMEAASGTPSVAYIEEFQD